LQAFRAARRTSNATKSAAALFLRESLLQTISLAEHVKQIAPRHQLPERTRLVGFKFGYAISQTRYLSWLGGVAASHRRQRVARALLERQHAWAEQRRFSVIETGTTSSNAAMLALNLSVGFEIIGSYAREATPRVVLQKRLPSPGIT
jgi:GNAT superfamily N-acetyltransferase